MKRHLISGILALSTLLVSFAAAAEDIDLFTNTAPTTAADVPNVLFIIDNTANWNNAFTNEVAALVSTFAALPNDKFRIGVMLSSETGGGNSGADGGYVRAAMRLMNSSNKVAYQNLINSLSKLGDKGNGGKSSLTMAEAYRYFSAGAPYAGNGKVKTDYTGNVAGGTVASNAIYALPGNALASKDATSYQNPITSGCQKNFIIYISNGAAQDNSTVTTLAATMLTSAGGDATQIALSPSGSQSNVMDEWSRFMRSSPLGIVTYTVDVDPISSGQGPGWSALLKSVAADPSRYFSVTSGSGGSEIALAVNKALSEIQSVNSVFAAVSLPVSVNTQGTYLNQVYIGEFRPDANGFPRWAGNMKQYKLGMINNALKLEDADSAAAINSQTGFVTECARSFWTPSTADNYWAFNPHGSCLAYANSANSNFPDGNVVEKGGQAYTLRSTTTRTVKTCSTSFASCTSLINFDTASVTPAMLGLTAGDTATRDRLVNWERGLDTEDENNNAVTNAEMRPSAHGDVVHSRPIALNFGSAATPSVVVFYGGNDGVLRAINGNRSSNIGGTLPGQELWAFVAPEFYGSIQRIHDNSTQISYPNITGGSPKPYGMDGPMAAYQSGSQAWIYASMRRGGRALYAFDVSSPASPSLKWKIGCPKAADDVGCSTGLSGIGQTWSTPQNLKVAGYRTGAAGTEKPLLIMGGGYDKCEDSDPNTCVAASKGKQIYVLDADTGTVLQTMATDRSVVGDVAIVPDASGLAIYAYAADLGGNVYRITIGSAAPGSWSITKLAALGCATTSTCSANRKFMFGPDVVSDSGSYVLMIGSGDREKPLTSFTTAASVSNYFFKIIDTPSDPAWLTAEVANCTSAFLCLNSLLPITGTTAPTQTALATKKGWYLGLAATEQVVTSSITVFGTTTFSTHTPAVLVPGACTSNLGIAKVYNIAYTNAGPSGSATSRFDTVVGGGLSPSPKAGIVTLDNGSVVTFIIGGKKDSPIEAMLAPTPPGSGTNQPKKRVYWYIQK